MAHEPAYVESEPERLLGDVRYTAGVLSRKLCELIAFYEKELPADTWPERRDPLTMIAEEDALLAACIRRIEVAARICANAHADAVAALDSHPLNERSE